MSKAKYLTGAIIGLLIHTLSGAQKLPDLGETWQGEIPGKTFMLFNGAYPYVELVIDSVRYTVIIDTKKGSRVKCIFTNDKRLRFHGDTVLGKPLNAFKNTSRTKYIMGAGHYVPLGDDWYAGFHFKALSDTSKCITALKYRF